MLPGHADLCKLASKLESKILKESKFHPAFMSELQTLLLDVYASLLPTASEYEQRKQLILAYDMTVKSIFGNTGGFPVVEAFGSFIMNIFTANSDLDLSINFNSSNDATCFPRNQVISVLRRLTKILYKKQGKGHLFGVLPVLHARVPVLKAVDSKTGIECDISVENKAGISRSLFFSIISSIDERFRIMSYLMKAWAKANDINSSKDHTMNSLTIISLVAFHFQTWQSGRIPKQEPYYVALHLAKYLSWIILHEQTRDPPILPPFSTLLRNGTDITNLRNAVLALKNFGARNKESVAELFVALLAKLSSVEKLWELGLCASIFEGSWMSKTWDSKIGNMSIEDFLDRSQNFARSVGKLQMSKIYDCLRGSLKLLSCSMNGQTELSVLGSVLFGPISFDARRNRVKTKAPTIIKQKLPIQSVQPIVDVIDRGDQAERQKQTRSESTQTRVDNTTMTLKRKLTSTKPLVTASNLPSHNSIHKHEQKLPAIELSQQDIKAIAPKKARYSNAAAASSFHSHRSQTTLLSPSPIIYPTPLHVLPQPIGGFGHPHISFRNPMRPIQATMVHLPYHNQLIYPSQHPMAHVHPLYGPQGPYNFPNPMRPTIHGYPIDRRGNPHQVLPS